MQRTTLTLILMPVLALVSACKSQQASEEEATESALDQVAPGPPEIIEGREILHIDEVAIGDEVRYLSDASGKFYITAKDWLLRVEPLAEGGSAQAQIVVEDASLIAVRHGHLLGLQGSTLVEFPESAGRSGRELHELDLMGQLTLELLGDWAVSLRDDNRLVAVPLRGVGEPHVSPAVPGADAYTSSLLSVRDTAVAWTGFDDTNSYVYVSSPPFDTVDTTITLPRSEGTIHLAAWAGDDSLVYVVVDEAGSGRILRRTGQRTTLLLDGIAKGELARCRADAYATVCAADGKIWRVGPESHAELQFPAHYQKLRFDPSGPSWWIHDGVADLWRLYSASPKATRSEPLAIDMAMLEGLLIPGEISVTLAPAQDVGTKKPGFPALDDAAAEHRDELAACYAKMLRKHPGAAGDVKISITATPDKPPGTNAFAQENLKESDLYEALLLGKCLEEAVSSWEVAIEGDPIKIVTMNVTFGVTPRASDPGG